MRLIGHAARLGAIRNARI